MPSVAALQGVTPQQPLPRVPVASIEEMEAALKSKPPSKPSKASQAQAHAQVPAQQEDSPPLPGGVKIIPGLLQAHSHRHRQPHLPGSAPARGVSGLDAIAQVVAMQLLCNYYVITL